MVQEAVKKAENLEIKLSPEDYVEILQNAMKLMVEERLIKDKDAPKCVAAPSQSCSFSQ